MPNSPQGNELRRKARLARGIARKLREQHNHQKADGYIRSAERLEQRAEIEDAQYTRRKNPQTS